MKEFLGLLFTGLFVIPGYAAFYPYQESFESGFGSWAHVSAPNWSRNSGGTASSYTGPETAHDGDYYIYTEASSSGHPYIAFQIQSAFDISSLDFPKMSLRYHMYGDDMGTLSVAVDVGTGWSTIHTISGRKHFSHDDPWSIAEIDLWAYKSTNLAIRITGTTGDGFRSDICIDDIWIYDEEDTPFDFDWSPIDADQFSGQPIAVEVRAVDYWGQTLTSFNSDVVIGAWSAGFADACLNGDFEDATSAPWTPMNAGPTPGPYTFAYYDPTYVNGFGIRPDNTPDGISQEIELKGGETYSISAIYGVENTGSLDISDRVDLKIMIDGTLIVYDWFSNVYSGGPYLYTMTRSFTPPADGTYTLSLTAETGSAENPFLWAYFDNISVNFAPPQRVPTSPQRVQFVDGVWTGDVTINERMPEMHLFARYAELFGNSGTFTTYASPFDLDRDNLPDSWETTYFASTAACLPGDDFDGDGYVNSDEYIIGSNPALKSSHLAFSATAAGDDLVLSWFTAPGRSYDLKFSPCLIPVSFSDLATNIPYTQSNYTNNIPSDSDQGFYLLDVEMN